MSQCPDKYFNDETDPADRVCTACTNSGEECGTCIRASFCTSCLGSAYLKVTNLNGDDSPIEPYEGSCV